MRSGPGTDYDVADSVSYGQKVDVNFINHLLRTDTVVSVSGAENG